MKYIKPYQIFEASATAPAALTEEQIKWLDKCVGGNFGNISGSWELNPQTGLVDVSSDFNCSGQDLADFRGVRFGRVGGSFFCANNQLSTLEGAPQTIGRNFHCSANRLTSLKGAPQEVGGDFSCSDNQLTTLDGAPQKIGKHFNCRNNQLTTLEGAPQTIGNCIDCPESQFHWFDCSENQLTSLEGAPQTVGGDFSCEKNPVSDVTLKSIFSLMEKGESHIQAIETLWNEIPLEDRVLLYRPGFNWVKPGEIRALSHYSNIKGMI